MLNQDKLNKIKGILSAKSGTQVPKFQNAGSMPSKYQIYAKWAGKNAMSEEQFNTLDEQQQNIWINRATGKIDSREDSSIGTLNQQEYFAQDKMTGYPRVENVQTPVQQAQQQEKTQPLSTEEITAHNKPFTTLIDNTAGIKDAAKTILPETPIIAPTPKMEAKQEVLDMEEDTEAKAVQDQMLSNTKGSNPSATGIDPSLIESSENISVAPQSTNSSTGEPSLIQTPTPSGASTGASTGGKQSFMNKLNSPGMQKAGGYGAIVGQAADMVSNTLVDKSEFAEDDPTQGKGRQAYDAVANSLMAFSPVGTIVGGAMKAVGLINDITGQKTHGLSKDEATFNQIGGSYGGAEAQMAEGLSKSGKKYGLFAGGARRRANKFIEEAKRQQSVMQGIAKDAADRASSSTMLSQANALSLEHQLSGGYDQRYMRAAKSGAKIQYFKEPFKVNLTEAKEFLVTLTDTPLVFKQGGTILDQLDVKHTFKVTLSDPIEELKKGGKIRKNEEGEIVPDKCDVCGGDIVVQIHGEPVYICKECNKFFGVVPFKHKNGGTLERDIEVVETNTTQKSVIPEGALHKNKHHLDEVGVDDSELTKKGIPVVDNDGDQQAEIELNEIIFTLEVTKELESRYKEFYEEGTTESRKDELAIEAGRLLWKEILYNTDDRTGLINTLKQGGTINSPEPKKELGIKITQEDINIMVKKALLNLLNK